MAMRTHTATNEEGDSTSLRLVQRAYRALRSITEDLAFMNLAGMPSRRSPKRESPKAFYPLYIRQRLSGFWFLTALEWITLIQNEALSYSCCALAQPAPPCSVLYPAVDVVRFLCSAYCFLLLYSTYLELHVSRSLWCCRYR